VLFRARLEGGNGKEGEGSPLRRGEKGNTCFWDCTGGVAGRGRKRGEVKRGAFFIPAKKGEGKRDPGTYICTKYWKKKMGEKEKGLPFYIREGEGKKKRGRVALPTSN